jgi:hypothetical protein
VQLSADDQQLLSLTYSLCVLVWTDAETLGVAEGADGFVIETGIADAILQV